ncbi:hypothetical protein HCN44_005236 [Aphidius gifuensis]|uniref:BED-type domain-containing protein n=1 Tax=Aphidius gifuensis TaxID=684658 RepID=A0A834XUT7_APHGI|nr:hypothetical protein HCN44_005236 [Aphidius gifuensis]
MKPGGRPLHEIWTQGFKRTSKCDGKFTATCQYCFKEFSNTSSERLINHRANCQAIDTLASSSSDNNNKITSTNPNSTIITEDSVSILSYDSDASGASSPSISSRPSKKRKLSNLRSLNQYFLSLTDSDKKKIDRAVLNFFVSCNIPFKKLESKNFSELVKVMCPAYKPLSPTEIATECLNKAYDQLDESRFLLSASEGILMISNTTQEDDIHIIIHIICSNKKLLFLDQFIRKKNEYELSSIVDQAIFDAQIKTKIKIYAVITEDEYKSLDDDVWSLRCCKSFAASIDHDLIDSCLESKAKYLLNEFSHPNLQQSLEKNGGTTFTITKKSLPWEIFSLCSINLKAMRKVISDQKLSRDTINILIDDDDDRSEISFEKKIKEQLCILEPICSLKNKCSEGSNLGEISESLLKLVRDPKYSSISLKTEKMLTPIFYIANLLHPKYRGRQFDKDNECLMRVNQYLLDKISVEDLNVLANYRESSGIFNSAALKEQTDPVSFWSAVSLVHPSMTSFALKIFELPLTVCQFEPLVSNVNNLPPQRFKKYVELYYYLNVNN